MRDRGGNVARGQTASALGTCARNCGWRGDDETRGTKGQEMTKAKTCNSPIAIGNAVIIRTVTHYYTGRIVALSDAEIVLLDAAWIADTGRWSTALDTGALHEVEPYPAAVSISRGAIVDVTTWAHALPRDQR